MGDVIYVLVVTAFLNTGPPVTKNFEFESYDECTARGTSVTETLIGKQIPTTEDDEGESMPVQALVVDAEFGCLQMTQNIRA